MDKAKAVIRPMQEGDLEAVSELAMLANPFATREEYCQHLLDELREVPDLSFVATIDERVVGYVQAEVHADKAVLEDIAVAGEHQGKGIGTFLLNRELEALRTKRGKTVLAEVHYKCTPAIPFYYKHGFRIVGFKQDYFGKGHDAVMLEKAL